MSEPMTDERLEFLRDQLVHWWNDSSHTIAKELLAEVERLKDRNALLRGRQSQLEVEVERLLMNNRQLREENARITSDVTRMSVGYRKYLEWNEKGSGDE